MKKVIFSLLIFALFIGCAIDQQEIITSENAAEQSDNAIAVEAIKDDAQLLTWDEFPAELKNAKQITTYEDSKYSVYSHKFGPFGGNGGSYFGITPPNGTTIHAVGLRVGSLIDKIIVWYRRASGTIYVGMNKGGNGRTYKVLYFRHGEYIRRISGRASNLINRLNIYTNKGRSISGGGSGGRTFYAEVPAGYMILGFWGRSGRFVDQIGFKSYKSISLARPRPYAPPVNVTYSHYPRKTILKWYKVTGAKSYKVEVNYYSGGWRTWLTRTTTATSYTFNFIGAYRGRWRVTAVDYAGKKSPSSAWRYFKYTR